MVVKDFAKKIGAKILCKKWWSRILLKIGSQRFAQKCLAVKNFAQKFGGSKILRKELGVKGLAKKIGGQRFRAKMVVNDFAKKIGEGGSKILRKNFGGKDVFTLVEIAHFHQP
jgi:hypothetical protein